MTEGSTLDANLSWTPGLPEGWQPLYHEVIHAIAAIDPFAKVVDAKEKFGEMRVYMKEFDEPIFDLIDAATAKSRTLCQMCGEKGVLSRNGGFYATVCPKHSDGFEPAKFSPMRHVRMIIPKPDGEDADQKKEKPE
nr:hypothetical protein [Novosphingobium panipatense]